LADLDGDGHLDVLSGSWPGELFLFRGGPGRKFAAPVKLQYKDGKTINIGGGRRPDSGDMILIAGDAQFEKDKKGNTVIVYEGEKIAVPEGKQAGITGTASAVHAADWDGDGRPDLLLGDFATQKPDRPEPTAKEKAEHDKLRKELETHQKRFQGLINKVHGPDRSKDKAEREKAEKEFNAVMQKMQDLRSKLPPEYENHGWVWLFVRKAPAAEADSR
jgi:hypothetical protein